MTLINAPGGNEKSMKYTFRCKECGHTEELDIPMDKYSELKDKQFCVVCRGKAERVIEWEGSADINGGYEAVAGRAKWQQ